MKRMAVGYEPAGEYANEGTIFKPCNAESALWGDNHEVAKYEKSGTELKDVKKIV